MFTYGIIDQKKYLETGEFVAWSDDFDTLAEALKSLEDSVGDYKQQKEFGGIFIRFEGIEFIHWTQQKLFTWFYDREQEILEERKEYGYYDAASERSWYSQSVL